MVRREKQRKPDGRGGDAIKATQGCPGTRSPLVSLPAEIQGIITSHLVQFRDLNYLCCTCKILSAVVLPTLYRTIELKVPLRWSHLPSLENLLASPSEGLKYTKYLKIVTTQYRPEENAYPNLDADTIEHEQASGDEEEPIGDAGLDDNNVFRVSHPRTSASNALNAFIRMLIVKLRPQQLHTFWWEHTCSLDALTLSIVLKHQGASIRTLNFGQYTGKWKADRAKLTIGGLTTLGMEAGTVPNDSWARDLLARNYQTLRHLRLGNDKYLATEYADEGMVDIDSIRRFNKTDNLAQIMTVKIAALKQSSTPPLRLESLSLTGLDLNAFAKGFFEPIIDFDSLSVLKLESCSSLMLALPLLMGTGTSRRKAKSALRLHTLAIRHENTRNENANNEFTQSLETFLISLRPLAHLHVLLEGDYHDIVSLEQVLQVHGTCLQSLVWDERSGPRSEMHEGTALYLSDHENLQLVAKHCSGLKALGIVVDREDFMRCGKSREQIASSFSQLSQLQTLNIRNLPEINTPGTWVSNDYMMSGLAEMLLGIITKQSRIQEAQRLKTLAIGASVYRDAKLGMNHYDPNHVSTFLQLRIYHVNYDCQYRNYFSPKLHLIARGTPADAWGDAENLDIFALYWLDGVPKG